MNAAAADVAQPRSVVPVVFVIMAVVTAMLLPTARLLAAKWDATAENVLSHAWLVVVVVLWGLYHEARLLRPDATLRVAVAPFVLTVTISLIWALFANAAVAIPQQLLWLALICATLWSALGMAAIRALLRPLWIMALLMPIWGLPHQFLWFTSTRAVQAILSAIGVPAYFEGNTIHLASGAIEIASGCAGLAFFAAALAIGAIIGYLNRASLAQHIVLLGVAALIAMISNWIRISIIVFEAHRTDMQTSLITKDHFTFGWIVFAIALMGYCFVFARYGQRESAASDRVAAAVIVRPAPVIAALLCAAAGPILVAMTAAAIPAAQSQSITGELRDFHDASPRDALWYPRFPGADASVLLAMKGDAGPTYVYGNRYLYQANDHRLLGDGHSLLPSEHWEQTASRHTANFGELLAVAPNGQAWIFRYTYVAGRRLTPLPFEVQIAYGVQQFFSDPMAGVVAIAMKCTADCDAERAAQEARWSSVVAWYMNARHGTVD